MSDKSEYVDAVLFEGKIVDAEKSQIKIVVSPVSNFKYGLESLRRAVADTKNRKTIRCEFGNPTRRKFESSYSFNERASVIDDSNVGAEIDTSSIQLIEENNAAKVIAKVRFLIDSSTLNVGFAMRSLTTEYPDYRSISHIVTWDLVANTSTVG